MPRILLVEDDPQVVNLVSVSLTNAGFELEAVGDGQTALDFVERTKYDLLILDVIVPKVQGFDICRKVRAQSPVPILFLSGQSDPIDRTLGLELGADDYLTKPFAPQELVARVRAILRRYISGTGENAKSNASVLSVGDICIDFDKFIVTKRGAAVPLTATEFRLLACLAENLGRTLTRDDVREAVWGTSALGEQTVTSAINRLRNKLEDDPNNPAFILTMRGFGYRFCDPSKT